jgi:hypothetical protein
MRDLAFGRPLIAAAECLLSAVRYVRSGSVAGIGAIRPSGRCSAYCGHPGVKVGYRLWSRLSSAMGVRQGTAISGHWALPINSPLSGHLRSPRL